MKLYGLVILATLICGFTTSTIAAPTAVEDGLRTDLSRALLVTTYGPVRGEPDQGLAIFRGLPFAEPPVGDRRWRAPEPPSPWIRVRDATEFGPACPQLPNPFLPGVGPDAQDEDCLTLNAWTGAARPGEGRPVMVWIHGGGWATGSGSYSLYDGAYLARQHGLVVVTINYRLGALGGLAHAGLTAEAPYGASGDYGIQDQIRALEWVRDNASELGGDPGNVTIFGESAGGGSVCVLLASPLARGLFHRAIIQSGGCPKASRDLAEAEALGAEFAREVGCSRAADVITCLRSRSVSRVLHALPPDSGLLGNDRRYWPIVDGYVLEEAPGLAIEAGRHNRVPVMAGANANEAALFRSSYAFIDTVAEYRWAVRQTFGELADAVFEAYPVTRDDQALPAFERLVGDASFVCPTREYVRDLAPFEPRVFLYHFSWVSPLGEAMGWGAFHGSELAYVFHNLGRGADSDDRAVAEAMAGYWARFAASGDPNGPGAPAWPAYSLAEDPHLELTLPPRAGSLLRKAECDVLVPRD